jgi:hypothetical protein
MRLERDDLIASDDELVALSEALALERGPLAALPAAASAEGSGRTLDLLEGVDRLSGAVQSLARPSRRIDVRHVFGDESIGRTVMVWASDCDPQMVVLEELGRERRIGRRSESHVRGRLAKALAAPKEAPVLRRALSTSAALAFIAMTDCLRYAWLVSMLEHAQPVRRITAGDIRSRFECAGLDDSRWLLNFLDKVWPRTLAEHEVVGPLETTLDELEAAGLLVRVAEGPGTAYETVGQGGLLAAILGREDRKLGLTVQTAAEGVPPEVALLIRSPSHLLLVHMRGEEASLRLLGTRELQEWLERIVVCTPPSTEDLASQPTGGQTTSLGAVQTLVLNAPPTALMLALVQDKERQLFTLAAEATIGRQEGNTIVISEPGVSRTHARVRRDPRGLWFVEDLGTANGTFVNGRRIEKATPIAPGDVIRVSATALRVVAPGV